MTNRSPQSKPSFSCFSSIRIAFLVLYYQLSYVRKRKQKFMSKFLINLFIRFGKSESLRKAAINLLKDLATKSDNEVDDAIVKMMEEKLFPVK